MVLPLLVIGGVWGGFRLISSPSCSGSVKLSVAASPEIAPAVRTATTRWLKNEPRVADQCVEVEILSSQSADVAAAVAGDHGARINGLTQADAKAPVPHVWIPDSSIWLQRMREAGGDLVPTDAPSIARSPVAVAMPEPTAQAFGWANTKLTWAAILQRMVTDIRMHPGIVEPNRDSTAVAALIAMSSVVPQLGPQGDQITVGAIKTLQQGKSELPSALLLRFPQDNQARTLSSALSLAPLSEQAILEYNAAGPAVKLATLYPEPLATALDFPYTVLPRLTSQQEAVASALKAVLVGSTFRTDLSKQHLRAADGTADPTLTLGPTAPTGPGPIAPTPEPAAISKALKLWVEITRPSRLLAVLDASASMAQPVPTAGGLTREQVAVEAARGGLELFDKSWAVGLWIFSTDLDGDKDHRELVPINTVDTNKDELANALGTIAPKADGGTGLYDTVLAGYKELRKGWDPGRGNTLAIMTSGGNNNPAGINLDQLINELKRNAVRDQPVQIIFIGVGPDVPEKDLKRITDTTGGAVYTAPDPSKIGEIFVRALALMDTTG